MFKYSDTFLALIILSKVVIGISLALQAIFCIFELSPSAPLISLNKLYRLTYSLNFTEVILKCAAAVSILVLGFSWR